MGSSIARCTRAVARARAESPRAHELLASLAGRSIDARGSRHSLAVSRSHPTGPRLRVAAPEPGGARISGTPLSLLALTRSDPEAVIRRGDVSIDGDAEIAQQFSRSRVAAQARSGDTPCRSCWAAAVPTSSCAACAARPPGRARPPEPRYAISPSILPTRVGIWSRAASPHISCAKSSDARDQLDRLEARLLEPRAGTGAALMQLRVLRRLIADPARARAASAG